LKFADDDPKVTPGEPLRLNEMAFSAGTARGTRRGLVGGRMGRSFGTTLGLSRNFSTSDAKWKRGISISDGIPTITLSVITALPLESFMAFLSARVRSLVPVLSVAIFGTARSSPISFMEGLSVSPSRFSSKLWTRAFGGSTPSVLMNPKSSTTGGLPGATGAGFSEGVGEAGAGAAGA
jgi:hypothetical protein